MRNTTPVYAPWSNPLRGDRDGFGKRHPESESVLNGSPKGAQWKLPIQKRLNSTSACKRKDANKEDKQKEQLIAMASNLLAMASNLLAMASNLESRRKKERKKLEARGGERKLAGLPVVCCWCCCCWCCCCRCCAGRCCAGCSAGAGSSAAAAAAAGWSAAAAAAAAAAALGAADAWCAAAAWWSRSPRAGGSRTAGGGGGSIRLI